MSNSRSWRKQRWGSPQTLTPLMEGPDPEMELDDKNKKESSWEVIREWFRTQKGVSGNFSSVSPLRGNSNNIGFDAKRQDLRLLLGVLGCPLAPIPLSEKEDSPQYSIHIRDIPLERSTAHYIIQQYLAATGISKRQKPTKNMYAAGAVKMVCCETEMASGSGGKTTKTTLRSSGGRAAENGRFVVWQMMQPPAGNMWSLELAVGGNKVIAGSDGKTAWRHTPWLGTHAAKGPQRPLRRIIQGLDPKTTAGLFARAQCLGERQIGEDDCFVLKVSADADALTERSDGPAEVIRHALYGYFSQKSGLLIYLEDSHLTRVITTAPDNETVYWETTIGSSIGEYGYVDGIAVAHGGRAVATVFRFGEEGESTMRYSRTRMEEVWRIDDVVFDVPGLSVDSFIPPADIFDISYNQGIVN